MSFGISKSWLFNCCHAVTASDSDHQISKRIVLVRHHSNKWACIPALMLLMRLCVELDVRTLRFSNCLCCMHVAVPLHNKKQHILVPVSRALSLCAVVRCNIPCSHTMCTPISAWDASTIALLPLPHHLLQFPCHLHPHVLPFCLFTFFKRSQIDVSIHSHFRYKTTPRNPAWSFGPHWFYLLPAMGLALYRS